MYDEGCWKQAFLYQAPLRIHLVLQSTKEPEEVSVNMGAETLQKEYNGETATRHAETL